MLLCRYAGAIFFANVDRFVQDLYSCTFSPDRLTARRTTIVNGAATADGQANKKTVAGRGCFGRIRRGNVVLHSNGTQSPGKPDEYSDGNVGGLIESNSAVGLEQDEVVADEGLEVEDNCRPGMNGNGVVGNGDHSWPGGAGEPMVTTDHAGLSVQEPVVVMKDNEEEASKIDTIVIDCAAVSSVDVMGVNAIKKIWTAFGLVGVNVVASGCNDELQRKMRVIGLLKNGTAKAGMDAAADDDDDDADKMEIYQTVHDAVTAAKLKCTC